MELNRRDFLNMSLITGVGSLFIPKSVVELLTPINPQKKITKEGLSILVEDYLSFSISSTFNSGSSSELITACTKQKNPDLYKLLTKPNVDILSSTPIFIKVRATDEMYISGNFLLVSCTVNPLSDNELYNELYIESEFCSTGELFQLAA